MEGFRQRGRHAGASPKLLGNAATIESDEERASEQGGKEKAMPAVERLGRASPPLSVWLRAAAPEEIKKCPGLVVVVVYGDELCPCSEKDERGRSTANGLKTSEEATKQAIFSF